MEVYVSAFATAPVFILLSQMTERNKVLIIVVNAVLKENWMLKLNYLYSRLTLWIFVLKSNYIEKLNIETKKTL